MSNGGPGGTFDGSFVRAPPNAGLISNHSRGRGHQLVPILDAVMLELVLEYRNIRSMIA